MPLRKANSRTFQRCLYGGELKTITLLKRDDDQLQGTVRSVLVFDARRTQITKTGQTIQGDMSSNHRTDWHLPRVSLEQAGVNYINALDRIVEDTDDGGMPMIPPRVWQPESTTQIEVKLFENWVKVSCLNVTPPPPPGA